jgi:hopene-associated glycosyltransferase HpnB
MIALALGVLACAVWAYLLLARGGFWRARETDAAPAPAPAAWPAVAAVVPARDEADVIARSVGSLLAQDYPGPFTVILVDDESGDGTAEAARAAADRLGSQPRLEVLRGRPLPEGWTGKVWAMSQGIAHAEERTPTPAYLLLTDADIAHAPDNLRSLVARAEAGGLALTSLMAELHCRTWPERMLIPAFVLFFQMLYPFRWVNDKRRRLAAAAGGCMLARREALAAAGGVAQIRRAIIDDCALGALMKRQGPIWLGLTHRAQSIRPYVTVGETGRMIYRSAYAQLNYSVWLLAGTLLALALMFLAPPALALFANGAARWAGLAAWLAMAGLFQPMLRFYRRSPLWGLALPAIGLLYAVFTLRSAVEFWRGRGGMWKGRAQAIAGAA